VQIVKIVMRLLFKHRVPRKAASHHGLSLGCWYTEMVIFRDHSGDMRASARHQVTEEADTEKLRVILTPMDRDMEATQVCPSCRVHIWRDSRRKTVPERADEMLGAHAGERVGSLLSIRPEKQEELSVMTRKIGENAFVK
jgi:hypothetical protein